MEHAHSHIYEFGDFRVDASKRLLLQQDGEQIPLTPKAFDTLLYLVEHSGKIIGKDELMSAIWKDTIVEENNLSQNISILRRILGEKRGEHRFIATIPGHGFRFVADVREIDNVADSELRSLTASQPESSDRRVKSGKSGGLRLFAGGAVLIGLGLLAFYFWRANTTPPPVVPIKTIAVLPFKPLVEENRDEGLEMGMADTLISRLGNNRQIIVRPLSSVRKYGSLGQDALAAGRELGVDSVLDGSIQRWGDNIRVNVRLIKVADGSSLWAGTFEEKFGDYFVVQDAISQKLAASLALQLSSDEQGQLYKRYTENVAAYHFYERGLFLCNKRTPRDLRKSIEYFEKAIALDPNYALAFAGLADAYSLLANSNSGLPREMMPKAREAALKALSLDDNLTEAHCALGQIMIYYDYDFAGAEREYKRALQLNPGYATAHQWYGELLMALGRHEEALAEIRRALDIEPLSLIINRQYGVGLIFARRYDEAIEHLNKTLELDANFALAHSSIAMAYRLKGDYSASVEEFARFMELSGENTSAALIRQSFAAGGWQEFLRAMTGKNRPPKLTHYIVATFYAALDEKNKALKELNEARQERDTFLGLLKVDPRFDSLHSDPRFAALLKSMNF